MALIKKLPRDIVEKIAAGEVVERPASVVKELIENAIDAKSTSIVVNLKNGGKTLIEVIDTGTGIPADDLPLTIAQYATSKINTVADLYNLSSLGFRGEALYSIASVSRFSIHSRHVNEKIGNILKYTPPGPPQITPKPRNIGTTVTVKDLFFNLPARLKFLKGDKTELKHILDIVHSYALAYPNIKFVVTHNGKQVLSFSEDNVPARLARILKLEGSDLVSTQKIRYGSEVHIIMPKLQKQLHTPHFLKVFINGRVINSPIIAKAVKEALYKFVPPGTPVSAVVYLQVPPSTIDVNIHPRKLEVKFSNPYRVYSLIYNAITQTFLETRPIDIFPGNFTRGQRTPTKTPISTTLKSDSKISSPPTFSNLLTLSDSKSETPFGKDSQESTLHAHLKTTFYNNSVTNMLQVFKKYILYEIGSELWIVDQHAAYERIRYEKLLRQSQQHLVQNLLQPIKIPVPQDLLILAEELKTELQELGFKISIQKNKIILTQVPSFLPESQIKPLFMKALGVAKDPEEAKKEFAAVTEGIKNYMAAEMACHTAIRTGDTLTKPEMEKLIEDLINCQVPTSCPHGRPTITVLKITDIDKFFLRTY